MASRSPPSIRRKHQCGAWRGVACPEAPALAGRWAPAGLFSDGCSGTSLGCCVYCRPQGVEEQVSIVEVWLEPPSCCSQGAEGSALSGGARAVSVWVNSGSQGPA